MTHIYDYHGSAELLGEKIAAGGEGAVYPLSNRPKIVVKRYHEQYQAEQVRIDKVHALIAMYQKNSVLKALPLAWPQLEVFDSHRQWQGYAMKKVEGKKLSFFKIRKLVQKHFPGITRVDVVEMLLSLLNTAEQLHQQGIYIGDINLDNFLVDPNTNNVSFIDCDSFQVEHEHQLYACPVGTDSMIPPEHQGQNLRDVVRDEHSDTFSLTVICFMMLMSGRHPYEYIGGTSLTSNIANGHFPWGQSLRPGCEGAVPQGPWYTWWSHLSYNLKSAFMQTFTQGAKIPAERVCIADLKKLLAQYKWSMQQGHLTADMWPMTVKQASS